MNEIVKSETGVSAVQATPLAWQMITDVAQSGKKAGLGTAEKVQVQMLTAYEHGFPITSGPQICYVIEGKPSLSPKAVWAKVSASDELASADFERMEDEGEFFGYRITLKRRNGMSFTHQFTLKDALRAELADRNTWKKYPEHMAMWRCLGFVLDIVFADYTLGMLRASDLGANVNKEGDVVNEMWTVATVEQEPSGNGLALDLGSILTKLVQAVGADEIIEANGGEMPQDAQQALDVAEALGVEI